MQKQCSIIIPAFNAEKYIENTISRILTELVNDESFEVIIVNDGSTDDTAKILEQFKSNNLVKIIDKENGGASSARNAGIDASYGKYLYFCDADDNLILAKLKEGIGVLEQSAVDVAIFSYKTWNKRDGQKEEVKLDLEEDKIFGPKSVEQLLYKMATGKNRGLSNVWNKVFLSDVVKKHAIRFDERRTHGEDWAFCIDYLNVAKSAIYIDQPFYEYVVDGSQEWSKYVKTLGFSIIDGYEKIIKIIKEKNLTLSKQEMLSLKGNFLGQVVKFICLNEIEKTQIKEFLKNKRVKRIIRWGLRLSKNKLLKIGYSRKDRIWLFALRIGLYTRAIKMLKKI